MNDCCFAQVKLVIHFLRTCFPYQLRICNLFLTFWPTERTNVLLQNWFSPPPLIYWYTSLNTSSSWSCATMHQQSNEQLCRPLCLATTLLRRMSVLAERPIPRQTWSTWFLEWPRLRSDNCPNWLLRARGSNFSCRTPISKHKSCQYFGTKF